MSDLSMLLLLLSLVGLIVGLISPRLTIRWGNRRTRGRVVLTYGLAVVVFFILFGVTTPPVQQPAGNVVELEPELVEPAPEPEEQPPGLVEPPAPPSAQPIAGETFIVKAVSVRVIRVTDGDTIRVRLECGIEERVRFIGVDTPESTREVEPFGEEAAAFTQSKLDGETVFLEMDVTERDRFGRLLAYVWLAEPVNDNETEVRAKMFNAELLLQGYAQVMTIPPNVKYAEMFLKFEREARGTGKGLWTTAAPIGDDVSPAPAPATESNDRSS